MTLVHQGNFAQSVKLYQEILNPEELDDDIDESHYRALANALTLSGDKEQAARLLDQRMTLLKKHLPMEEKRLLQLTGALMFADLQNGNPANAINHYVNLPANVSREGPEAGHLFFLLGEASRQVHNFPNAEYGYQLALLHTGDHFIKTTILYRYADLLYETRGSQQAIDLLSQLDGFIPEVEPENQPLYFNDRALALAFYGRLLIEKAKANPKLREETASKAIYLYEEALKYVFQLPKTELFQGTVLDVTLQAGKAFEDMGYQDQAISLYNIMDNFLSTQSTKHPLFARSFWEVKIRLSKLQKKDKDLQAQLAIARVNSFLESFPADSPQLFEPTAALAWELIKKEQPEEARNLLLGILSRYNQHIEDYGTCDSGLDSLYTNNLLKAFTPTELIFIADEVLKKLRKANIEGHNIWQSRNCRMALATILDAMTKFQNEFSFATHPAERTIVARNIGIAAQLHRYNPVSHSLAIRKIKRNAADLPYSQEINRILTIGEEQLRLRMRLRDIMTTNGNSSVAAELTEEIENLAREHNTILETVQKQYPEAVIPSIPAPVHPASILEYLSENEATILWTVEDYGSQAIVITRDWVQAVSLPINLADMEALVTEIRKTLDQPDTRSPMDIRPFAMGSAYKLYQEIFEPVLPYINGKTKLYLLPDGPLSKLPFQVLPTRLPEATIKSPLDFMHYRGVTWLGDKYLMNYQPSLNNLYEQLTAKDQDQADSTHQLAYAGFGNPVMPRKEGEQDDHLLITAREHLKGLRQQLRSSFNFMGDNTLENLSHLPPLPKTEQQLRDIGQILGEDDYIYVGKSATLDQLQRLPLSRFKTLVFATHGLMAGKNMPEPGLVMTPVNDDYSTAILDSSTIASLRLNADRVILSACNTAELGKDNGLASLSTAFFQAGARSLLVSHWSTEQSATTELMVNIFQQLKKSPEQGLASALQYAAQDLRDNHRNTFHAHPMFWAPFVAIGQDH